MKDMQISGADFSLSLECVLPDIRKGMISVAPVLPEPGICFFVGAVRGIFSFVEDSEKLMSTLCLTVGQVVMCSLRKVSRLARPFKRGYKNVVRSSAARFLRL